MPDYGFDPANIAISIPGADGTNPSAAMVPHAALSSSGNPFGVASMGFALLGGLLKGMASVQAGEFNADIDRKNARLADISAGDAIARGHLAASMALIRGAALAGKQKSAFAAAGVKANAGSGVDAQVDTSLLSHLDADRISNDATREAWGYQVKESEFRQKAALDESAALNAAGASILGGITGAATYGTKTMLALS